MAVTAAAPSASVSAPKHKETDYDGCLIGNNCQPLTKKLKPGERLTDRQIKEAWKSAYVSNSPCCQARRAAGKAPKRIVYVNGIRTDKAGQCETLKRIANQTCAQVLGVHNATDGTMSDLWQSEQDRGLIDRARAGKSFSTHDGRNPAVDSLSDVMYWGVRSGEPPDIWAHSQGGAIASLASYDANNRLIHAGIPHGISGLNVTSFASAAQSWPSNISGQHFIQAQDEVPIQFGLGLDNRQDAANTGPHQQVVRFTGTPPNVQIPTAGEFQKEYQAAQLGRAPHAGWERSWTEYHDMNSIYLPAQRQKDGGCSPDGK